MAKAIYVGGGNFEQRPLPSEYEQVEYIESDGTQYINTEFYPKYNSRIVIEASGLGTTQWLFGTRDSTSATATKQFCMYRTASAVRADYFGTKSGASTSLNVSDTTTKIVYDMNCNVLAFDGKTITNTAVSSGTCSYPLYLLTLNNAGTAHANMAKVKLYSCKIYDNGTLVRDFVPCRYMGSTLLIKPIGLYDLVNNVFYQNANGSSKFTKGDSYTGNIARKVKQPYVGTDGVARKVKSGYVGVSGVARKHYESVSPLSARNVGDIVNLNVGGVSKEFIVVHKSNPYSGTSNKDGIILLMKDIYTMSAWGTGSVQQFASASAYTYLNTTFYNLLDSNIKSQIVSNSIPCSYADPTYGAATQTTVMKIFLLSATEVGSTASINEGTKLSYFSGASSSSASSIRIALYNGSAANWWLRSPYVVSTMAAGVRYIDSTGAPKYAGSSQSYGIRPALMLPSTAVL